VRVRDFCREIKDLDGRVKPYRVHASPERFSEDGLYNVMARLVRAARIMTGVLTGGPDKPGHDEGKK